MKYLDRNPELPQQNPQTQAVLLGVVDLTTDPPSFIVSNEYVIVRRAREAEGRIVEQYGFYRSMEDVPQEGKDDDSRRGE